MTDNNWTVQLISQAKKFNLNLPKDAQLQLLALIRSLSKIGPIQYEWHGQRSIGKKLAKKMANVFQTDYRVFL